MLFVESLERRDRLAFGLFGLERAGEHGLAVHQHGTTAALGLRLTAIFRRRDAELVAEHIEQRQTGFVERNLDVGTVDAARESAAGSRSGFGSNRRHAGWPPAIAATGRLVTVRTHLTATSRRWWPTHAPPTERPSGTIL